jgi:hypothetical protein
MFRSKYLPVKPQHLFHYFQPNPPVAGLALAPVHQARITV